MLTSLSGGAFFYGTFHRAVESVIDVSSDRANVQVLILCVAVGGMEGVIRRSGGFEAAARKLIGRMKKLPYYYETDDQIFVHAGIEEAAGVEWKHGTSKDVMLWKFPPSTGSFYKTIISGHVGTGLPELADNPDYHDIFYDGESHIYIDGAVYKDKGKLLLLGYDEHRVHLHRPHP